MDIDQVFTELWPLKKGLIFYFNGQPHLNKKDLRSKTNLRSWQKIKRIWGKKIHGDLHSSNGAVAQKAKRLKVTDGRTDSRSDGQTTLVIEDLKSSKFCLVLIKFTGF